jgi:hypothetical protein
VSDAEIAPLMASAFSERVVEFLTAVPPPSIPDHRRRLKVNHGWQAEMRRHRRGLTREDQDRSRSPSIQPRGVRPSERLVARPTHAVRDVPDAERLLHPEKQPAPAADANDGDAPVPDESEAAA